MMKLTLNLVLRCGKECICFIPESLPVKRLTTNILCIQSHNGVVHLQENGKQYILTS